MRPACIAAAARLFSGGHARGRLRSSHALQFARDLQRNRSSSIIRSPEKYSDSRGSHMSKRFLLALTVLALTTVLAAQEPKKENVTVPEAETNAAKAVQAA